LAISAARPALPPILTVTADILEGSSVPKETFSL